MIDEVFLFLDALFMEVPKNKLGAVIVRFIQFLILAGLVIGFLVWAYKKITQGNGASS